jgi:S-adenosylmethionine hydrolase
VIPEFAKPRLKKGKVSGEVLHIDDFGNIITNISKHDLEKAEVTEGSKLNIRLGEKTARVKFSSAYGEAPVKTPLALIGSHDFLEIALNQGNASKRFKTKAGDKVTISLKLRT